MLKQIYLEIGNICNLRCSFCPGTTRPPRQMTPDEFQIVLERIDGMTEMVYFHLMGEPLIHPQLGELIRLCRMKHLPVAITTNGTGLTSPQAEFLLDEGVRQVNVSLHALHPDSTETEHVFAFIRNAMEKQPLLYWNLRLWNDSGDLAMTRKRQQYLQRIAAAFDLAQVQWPPPGRKSRHLSGRLYLHTDTVFRWPDWTEAEGGAEGFCHALRAHLGILADGRVVPCCLDRNGELTLGNIFDNTLEEILLSPRAVAIRRGFDQNIRHEEFCRRCRFGERFKTR